MHLAEIPNIPQNQPGRVRWPGAIGTPALLPSRETPTTASTTDSVLIFLKTDEDIDENGTLQFSNKLAERILRTGHGVPRYESTMVPFGVAEPQPLATRCQPIDHGNTNASRQSAPQPELYPEQPAHPPHGIAERPERHDMHPCAKRKLPTDHGIARASHLCGCPNRTRWYRRSVPTVAAQTAWHDCFTQPTQVTSERPRP